MSFNEIKTDETRQNDSPKYKDKIDDFVWSYSRIESFTMCPYKFFLKYLYEGKLEKHNKFYASYGSVMHKIIERYYKGEIDKDSMVTEFLLTFNQEIGGYRPAENVVKRYINAAVKYLANFEPFPYKMVSVEEKVEFKIGEYDFVGYIDFLGEENGELVIVDNKSRDLKPRSGRANPTKNDETLDKMLMQLYLYAEGCKQKYGKYPAKLCFNCFKNGEFIEEKFDSDKLKEAIDYVLAMIEVIEMEESFPANREFFQCHYLCDFNSDCEFDQSERRGRSCGSMRSHQ